jgi:hypothetical protein
LDFLKDLQRKLANVIDGTKVYSGCAPVFFDFLQLDEDKNGGELVFTELRLQIEGFTNLSGLVRHAS